jgi:hypothetical protein
MKSLITILKRQMNRPPVLRRNRPPVLRVIAVILSIAIILPIIACGSVSDNSEQSPRPGEGTSGQAEDLHEQDTSEQDLTPDEEPPSQIVSRGQWLEMLTSATDSNLLHDRENVVFFTDVSSGDPFYDAIQIAAAYEWIDTDPETFEPNDEITRAFVAVSTAKALGLRGEPVSELSDIHEHRESDYIRLAVDNEIFSPKNGVFNPDGAVLLDECREILSRVRAAATLTIDPNHVDIMTLVDGVIDLQSAVGAITINDSAAMSVTVTEEIAAGLDIGTVYIIPPSAAFPDGVARKVLSINQNGDSYTINNEVPAIEEVISEIDVQVESYADLSGIVWDDNVTVKSFDVGTQSLSAGQDGFAVQSLGYQAQPVVSSTTSATLKFGSGVTATIAIDNLSYKCRIRQCAGIPLETLVQINASYTVTLDAAAAKIEETLDLFKLKIPLKFGISLELAASLGIDGSISISISNESSIQVDYSSGTLGFGPSARVRTIESNWDTEPKSTANFESGFSLSLSLSVFSIPLIKGSATLGIGVTASLFSDCNDIWIYVKCYLKFALFPKLEDVLELTHKIEIWDKKNSPISERWHYEEGVRVDYCTHNADKIIELWESLGGGTWLSENGRRLIFTIDTEGEFAGRPRATGGHDTWSYIPFCIVKDMAIISEYSYRLYSIEELRGVWQDFVVTIDISELSEGTILFGEVHYFKRW